MSIAGEFLYNEPQTTANSPLQMKDILVPTLLNRRQILLGLGATVAGCALPKTPADAKDQPKINSVEKSDFSFVHITDTHIQPELGARDGVKKAFDTIAALPEKPQFALVGGDLVMDANAVDRKRAELIYDLWQEAADQLKLPLHYSIGNHDAFATSGESKLSGDDPEFGKKWWQKRLKLENRYSVFETNGWKFITLDSVQIDNDGKWWGELDAEQMNWLGDIFRKTDDKQPVVVLTHVPIMTIVGLYTEGTTTALSSGTIVKNGKQFKEMIQGKNVKAVLQGHTHVVEECAYLGTRYITGGAVCGDWWKGLRLGVHPEGFGLVTAHGSDLAYRYVPYGWKARS